MKFHCWNFAMLDDPVVVRVVTIQIMSAPCLIVAFNGNDNLNQPAKVFLRQSARAMRAAGTALVVQLHGIPGGKEEQLPSFRCLQEIAAIAGIPFFSEVINSSADHFSRKIVSFPIQSPVKNKARRVHAEINDRRPRSCNEFGVSSGVHPN